MSISYHQCFTFIFHNTELFYLRVLLARFICVCLSMYVIYDWWLSLSTIKCRPASSPVRTLLPSVVSLFPSAGGENEMGFLFALNVNMKQILGFKDRIETHKKPSNVVRDTSLPNQETHVSCLERHRHSRRLNDKQVDSRYAYYLRNKYIYTWVIS